MGVSDAVSGRPRNRARIKTSKRLWVLRKTHSFSTILIPNKIATIYRDLCLVVLDPCPLGISFPQAALKLMVFPFSAVLTKFMAGLQKISLSLCSSDGALGIWVTACGDFHIITEQQVTGALLYVFAVIYLVESIKMQVLGFEKAMQRWRVYLQYAAYKLLVVCSLRYSYGRNYAFIARLWCLSGAR